MRKVPLFQHALVGLAVTTACGILVHDTKAEQATALALALPISVAALSLHSDGHTHVERGDYGRTHSTGMPRIQPRDDRRRFYTPKNLSRSTDTFGESALLWPSV